MLQTEIQHADSSVAAEESSPAETTQKADNSQTDAPADQEEEKEPSHDLTGADAEGYIHDASYETRANAAAGRGAALRAIPTEGCGWCFFYYFDGEVPVITCRREPILFPMMPARMVRMRI